MTIFLSKHKNCITTSYFYGISCDQKFVLMILKKPKLTMSIVHVFKCMNPDMVRYSNNNLLTFILHVFFRFKTISKNIHSKVELLQKIILYSIFITVHYLRWVKNRQHFKNSFGKNSNYLSL